MSSGIRLWLGFSVFVSGTLCGAETDYRSFDCRTLFDQGHHNVHTIEKGHVELAALLRSHGMTISTGSGSLALSKLDSTDVLIISTPRGAPATDSMEARARSAFDSSEIEAVFSWVTKGGGLLLMTDHPPIGNASSALARRFGVDMSTAFTEDPRLRTEDLDSPDRRTISFSRKNRSLADHPITAGAEPGQRVDRVTTFYGQSLTGPPGSSSFLKLSSRAIDRQLSWNGRFWDPPSASDPTVSAAGRSQGIAFATGAGRVVVLGEAGFLTDRHLATARPSHSNSRSEHGRLVLNIVDWLIGDRPCRLLDRDD